MSWNATNCPDGLPDSSTLNIPSNITFAYVPSASTNNEAFVACCDPNPVTVADSCFAWCEAPTTLASIQDFSNCLINERDDIRWIHGILGFHEKNEGASSSSPMVLFVLGICVLTVAAPF